MPDTAHGEATATRAGGIASGALRRGLGSLGRWQRALLLGVCVGGVALSGAGCSSASKSSSLRTEVTDFARYMRWGQVEKAADKVPPARRIQFIAQKRAAQASMVIHEYDIRAVDPDPSGERARVLIAASWSRPNDPVMRSELFEQVWEWSDRHWQLVEQNAVETPAMSSPQDGL